MYDYLSTPRKATFENFLRGFLGAFLGRSLKGIFYFGAKLGLFLGLNGAIFSTLLFMHTYWSKRKSAPFGALRILFPIKDNFTGSPATHSVEAFLEVINFEVVRDDWRQI